MGAGEGRVGVRAGVVLVLVLVVGATTAGRADARQVPLGTSMPALAAPDRFDITLVTEWVDTVARHEPGQVDGALVGASGWSGQQLQRLSADIQVLIAVAAQPKQKRFRAAALRGPGTSRGSDVAVAVSRADRKALEALAAQVVARGLAETLQRAALLHTDVATLAPDLAARAAGPMAAGAAMKALVDDGGRAGTEAVSTHWALARLALDRLAPHPREHPFVREWYRATVALAQSTEFWDAFHLDTGLAIFPDDPVLQFLKGCQHEAYAAPLYQELMRRFSSQSVRPDIDATSKELDRAERAFRHALLGEPAHAEARMHLGRVLALRGRRAEAMRELDRAIEQGLSPTLEYYARLVLGAEYQGGGALAEARTHFRRAVALDPRSRVARLALAQIARELGERDEVMTELTQALAAATPGDAGDWWWAYRVSQAAGAGAWLDAVRRAWIRASP